MWRGVAVAMVATVLATSVTAECGGASADSQVEIYPTAKQLPENLLRIYVYVPERITVQDSLAHITLNDASGTPVEGVFLPNRYDLLSPDRRRLTLVLDPGRVKTGLVAHNTLGRALIPGETYSLAIDENALTGRACPGAEPTEFQFTIIGADVSQPEPSDWTITPPAAGTRDPVTIDLGSPHDHLSLAYRLRVKTAKGERVGGHIHLSERESRWHFTPVSPWADTPYAIEIDERLEDLAGNRPGRLFDQHVETPPNQWTRSLTWHPG